MSQDEVKVTVSPDRMAAFIRLPVGGQVTTQDLRKALAHEGVRAGISPAALHEAVTGQRGVFYQIAWGHRPSESPEGAPLVVLKFPRSKGEPPSRIEVGPGFRDEWKRLRDRGAVGAGDVLAFLRNVDRYPRALTVTGDQIIFVEFPPDVQPGKNASLSKDGTTVIAARPGIPYQSDSGLGVCDHIEISGNVGSLTGDIAFPGDLSIRGNVEAGFRVAATGDILISGNLYGSAATRGRIIVSGGINAPGESVESGKGVSCRFCENSLIRSAGPVVVSEACLHSVIETDAHFEAAGEKGRIVGGLIRASVSVRAGTVGSAMGISTVVEVGISPKLRHEHARIQRELEKVRSELAEAERTGRRPAQSANDFDVIRLYRMKKLLRDQEMHLTDRLLSMNDSLSRLSGGYFEALHVLPGVRLVMGIDVTEFGQPIDRVIKGAIPREAN